MYCISQVSHCFHKIPEEKQCKEGRLISALGSQWRRHGSRSWRQLIFESASRKQRVRNTVAQLTFSYLFIPRPQPTEWCTLTWSRLPYSSKRLWKHSYRHSQKCLLCGSMSSQVDSEDWPPPMHKINLELPEELSSSLLLVASSVLVSFSPLVTRWLINVKDQARNSRVQELMDTMSSYSQKGGSLPASTALPGQHCSSYTNNFISHFMSLRPLYLTKRSY